MKAATAFFAVLLIATVLAAAPAPAPLLLTGARVLDPSGDRLLDPLEDISVLEKPVLVVKDGRVAVDRR